MKKNHIVFTLLFPLMIFSQVSLEVPQTKISNDFITANILLPDFEKGYYQAARFDWSGIISELEFDGHSYFGKWFKNYHPKNNEAVMGPAECFDPIGYDEAQVGEPFIKIGVGALSKPEESKYFFGNPYDIVNPGVWEIEKSSNKVAFTHTLKNGSYSYAYKKDVSLLDGKPVMVLDHSITNTGKKPLETEVYNHNFFVIDSVPIGPGYVVKFPFPLICDSKALGKFVEIEGSQIVFIKNLEANDNTKLESITGYTSDASDYDIRIENQKTGAGVRITCDRPISQLAFWSAHKTICPEPYIHIKVEPGETFTWQITYNYYSL